MEPQETQVKKRYAGLADYLIQRAQREGKFDNLEGSGKPIPDLDAPYDENWWMKKLIERERLVAYFRGEDAEKMSK